jgi:hypothetical protein
MRIVPLDKALGRHLTAVSAKFSLDYTPLTLPLQQLMQTVRV